MQEARHERGYMIPLHEIPKWAKLNYKNVIN